MYHNHGTHMPQLENPSAANYRAHILWSPNERPHGLQLRLDAARTKLINFFFKGNKKPKEVKVLAKNYFLRKNTMTRIDLIV